MKSVIIISLITFVFIFGGVLLVSNHLDKAAQTGALPTLTPQDYEATERVYLDLAAERDRIQQEKEELLAKQQEFAIQTQTLADARTNLQAVIAKLESRQQAFIDEKERSAAKLAKMYEAMKPAQAAPILAALDMDIILEIMTRMKERQAAKILAQMDAGLAAQISTRMSIKGAG